MMKWTSIKRADREYPLLKFAMDGKQSNELIYHFFRMVNYFTHQKIQIIHVLPFI